MARVTIPKDGETFTRLVSVHSRSESETDDGEEKQSGASSLGKYVTIGFAVFWTVVLVGELIQAYAKLILAGAVKGNYFAALTKWFVFNLFFLTAAWLVPLLYVTYFHAWRGDGKSHRYDNHWTRRMWNDSSFRSHMPGGFAPWILAYSLVLLLFCDQFLTETVRSTAADAAEGNVCAMAQGFSFTEVDENPTCRPLLVRGRLKCEEYQEEGHSGVAPNNNNTRGCRAFCSNPSLQQAKTNCNASSEGENGTACAAYKIANAQWADGTGRQFINCGIPPCKVLTQYTESPNYVQVCWRTNDDEEGQPDLVEFTALSVFSKISLYVAGPEVQFSDRPYTPWYDPAEIDSVLNGYTWKPGMMPRKDGTKFLSETGGTVVPWDLLRHYVMRDHEGAGGCKTRCFSWKFRSVTLQQIIEYIPTMGAAAGVVGGIPYLMRDPAAALISKIRGFPVFIRRNTDPQELQDILDRVGDHWMKPRHGGTHCYAVLVLLCCWLLPYFLCWCIAGGEFEYVSTTMALNFSCLMAAMTVVVQLIGLDKHVLLTRDLFNSGEDTFLGSKGRETKLSLYDWFQLRPVQRFAYLVDHAAKVSEDDAVKAEAALKETGDKANQDFAVHCTHRLEIDYSKDKDADKSNKSHVFDVCVQKAVVYPDTVGYLVGKAGAGKVLVHWPALNVGDLEVDMPCLRQGGAVWNKLLASVQEVKERTGLVDDDEELSADG